MGDADVESLASHHRLDSVPPQLGQLIKVDMTLLKEKKKVKLPDEIENLFR